MNKTTTTTTANNEEKKQSFRTVIKGTLTRFRWEKGFKGKGNERWNISVKVDGGVTDELRKKILEETGLTVDSAWCPAWLKKDLGYVNVHTNFDLPCQLTGKNGSYYECDMNEVFEGAEVALRIVCKDGVVYPQALRVYKNGEPYNPFDDFED